MMTKVVRFYQTGDASVLKLEDIPLKELKDNEVRISVRAIATQEEDLASCVMEITNNHGADIILDAIAGTLLNDLADAAASGATIFVYGALDTESQTPFPVLSAVGKGLKVRGYTMGDLFHYPEAFTKAKSYIYRQLESGILQPNVDSQTFSLDEIAEAHRYMESNQAKGKIIVKV